MLRYEAERCPNLTLPDQLFPPQEEEGDVRLRDLRVVRPPRTMTQRAPPPRPSQAAGSPDHTAPAARPMTTQTRDTRTPLRQPTAETRASRFFVPIIAAATGFWHPDSMVPGHAWHPLREAIGPELFDSIAATARASHTPEENEAHCNLLQAGNGYIMASAQEAYLASTRQSPLWPLLEVVLTRLYREGGERRRPREEEEGTTPIPVASGAAPVATPTIDVDDVDELLRAVTPAARRRLEHILGPATPITQQQQPTSLTVAEQFIDASRGTSTIQLCPGVRVSLNVSDRERVWSPHLHDDANSWETSFDAACKLLRISAVSAEAATKLNASVEIYAAILQCPFPGAPGTPAVTKEHWSARVLAFEAVAVAFAAAYVGADAATSLAAKLKTAWQTGRYEPAILVAASLLSAPSKKEPQPVSSPATSHEQPPYPATGRGVSRFIEEMKRGQKGGQRRQ